MESHVSMPQDPRRAIVPVAMVVLLVVIVLVLVRAGGHPAAAASSVLAGVTHIRGIAAATIAGR
jgi:hypothetical protein